MLGFLIARFSMGASAVAPSLDDVRHRHRKKILAKIDELGSNQTAIKRGKPAANAAAVAAAQGSSNKLFLSYARGDESTPFARCLKAFLEEYGFAVWMDEEGIAGGVDFMSAIGKSSLLPSRFAPRANRSRPFTCAF